ncbi:MAG: hypothetical protein JWR15_4220 [Prosthecobacter sp.]|nr:hypothetical protein [Prosthecobacter sp.]
MHDLDAWTLIGNKGCRYAHPLATGWEGSAIDGKTVVSVRQLGTEMSLGNGAGISRLNSQLETCCGLMPVSENNSARENPTKILPGL